ncbi:hypothetical protein WKI13_09620 [Teredinibacter turnerae]|uniref:hypothetical protein n=1 Tax=Teredinibacter turnerae TaxID=2426 RepID=UPI0003604A0D|nr:hypothetical protein [Teredinibacter turnerae]
MLIEHIVFTERAENALVRLAMVVELHDHKRFRVFQGLREKLRLIKFAMASRQPKVRQQLELFREQLNKEQKRALLEINLDLWALQPIPGVGDISTFEKAVQERLARQKKVYRGAKVA